MISRRTLLGAGTAAVGLSALPAGAVFASGSSTPWSQLASHLQGQLVLPTDPTYSTAKQLELMQFDAINPQGVAYCVSPTDVSVAMRFAQDNCLPATVRSGGHSYGGYSTTPGLIIDTSRLNAVTLSASGSVSLGPGSQNVDILNTLAPYGLVVSEGGCPTVAVGGFLQGGGFGFLTRPTGMACDAMTSAQMVLADGSIVTASAQQNPDLFWAIRGGGGGNFGVVTSYTVTPHSGDAMAFANLSFSYDSTAEVLNGLTQWMVNAPRTIGGGAYIVMADAAAGTVPTTTVSLASRGTPTELTAEISRLISLTGVAPVNQQSATMTYRDLMMMVFGCGGLTQDQCHRVGATSTGQIARPSYSLERTRLFSGPTLDQTGWAQVMTAFEADRIAGQLRNLEVQMWGGAANDPQRTDTAYVHRDSLFSVAYRTTINDPAADSTASRAVARTWVDASFATIDPYSNGETYQNWMDPALTDWKSSYYAENYPRLAQIKSSYDPYRFFRFAQGIGAAG
ncbi:FAD/FMN-containing dehydrogenase [Kitasatospora sp. MAA4]|uniref:FAD-binding oxidoreductase n=1 Tax=Kitasatospora sp. MAA4 TaxID=3035093 RepID=UPI0024733BAC|nr:FAD-binding protein [Kitasatospora sp. MAA4]MDH6132648.1 FAD/FMN-containing dehydrogenase [Kitasatospora sp. MAA4]